MKHADKFAEVFEPGEVYVDLAEYDILIGQVSRLAVAPDGRIALLDEVARKAWLIDPVRHSATELNPTSSHPGLTWNPQFAVFAPGGDVVVISAPLSNVLFVFGHDGRLRREIAYEDKPTAAIRDVWCSAQGVLLLSYTRADREFGIVKLLYDTQRCAVSRVGSYQLNPRKYRNFLSRLDGGIQLAVDEQDSVIYQTFASGPEVFRYSLRFQPMGTYRRVPKVFHPLMRDLRYPTEFVMSREAIEMVSSATTLEGLFLLSGGLLVIQYLDRSLKGFLIDFLTPQGEYLTKGGVIAPHRVMAARGDYVYAVRPVTTLDEEGNLPNPKIIRYRLRRAMR